MQNSIKQPIRQAPVLDDKFLGERLKEINISPKRIEDVIKERRIERATSKQTLYR